MEDLEVTFGLVGINEGVSPIRIALRFVGGSLSSPGSLIASISTGQSYDEELDVLVGATQPVQIECAEYLVDDLF